MSSGASDRTCRGSCATLFCRHIQCLRIHTRVSLRCHPSSLFPVISLSLSLFFLLASCFPKLRVCVCFLLFIFRFAILFVTAGQRNSSFLRHSLLTRPFSLERRTFFSRNASFGLVVTLVHPPLSVSIPTTTSQPHDASLESFFGRGPAGGDGTAGCWPGNWTPTFAWFLPSGLGWRFAETSPRRLCCCQCSSGCGRCCGRDTARCCSAVRGPGRTSCGCGSAIRGSRGTTCGSSTDSGSGQ
jgi:hypothetical protein